MSELEAVMSHLLLQQVDGAPQKTLKTTWRAHQSNDTEREGEPLKVYLRLVNEEAHTSRAHVKINPELVQFVIFRPKHLQKKKET